ncbi:hypothetical protein RRG55_04325 [Mycoplasmopsis felis]|uniref:hypothetical protein n=1 Tax=Mycoplasmopsis felis TaxID=33923 RepID=UPI002AFF8E4C|nr:hypothetical protein [Mycoplasmopsis felis]WQQ04274.1 hypothetical protein RRG47_01745 [Mycoplasmopsis felis]
MGIIICFKFSFAFSILSKFIIPAPVFESKRLCFLVPIFNSLEDEAIIDFIDWTLWILLFISLFSGNDKNNEIAPETVGAAKLVPYINSLLVIFSSSLLCPNSFNNLLLKYENVPGAKTKGLEISYNCYLFFN